MKKSGLLFLVFILFVPFTYSVQTEHTADFSNVTYKEVELPEKDSLIFYFLGGEHALVLRGIHEKGVDLSIFPYRNGTVYVTITPEKYIRLDLNKDRNDDLEVRLAQKNEHSALLRFDILSPPTSKNETVQNSIDGAGHTIVNTFFEKEEKNPNPLYGYFIVVGIVGMGILVFIFFRKKE